MKHFKLNRISQVIALVVFTLNGAIVCAAPIDKGEPGSGPVAEGDIPFNTDSGTKGMFGPAVHWPSIPIHLTLLPDGKVLSFGSGQVSNNVMSHSIWDPTQGTVDSAHTILPNPVGSDIFCAGQTIIPSTGETMVAGGSEKINGIFNYSISKAHLFDHSTQELKLDAPMTFKRWYPTLVTLATGRVVVLGGRDDKDAPTYASTPELYTPGVGYKTLPTAKNEDAYGKNFTSWNYPKGFLAPNGKVFIVANSGKTFYLDVDGNNGDGLITKLTANASISSTSQPSLLYAPGKIFSVRGSVSNPQNARIIHLDADGQVTLENTLGPSQLRYHGSLTVMADGKVLLTGGSSVINKLQGVANYAEIWDPVAKTWAIGASNVKPRLYHSNALLLADGTVLTGGGGKGGAIDNLNIEIYYPPYLYKQDGSGMPAVRPKITTAPDGLAWNTSFDVGYTSETPVSRVTLVRSGSATHNLNVDQRFMELAFIQNGDNQIQVTGPVDRNIAPPGYYLLFIFDQKGVPSVSKIIHLQE